MCEQLSTHIGPDAGAFVLHRKRRITHVPYWWVNNPTLGEFCFAMIGRADIEGSKSDVAMDAWPPQASYPCGSISHAFAVRIRTENQDQVSICLFALREVSVLSELALGHLRYALTDVPPQSNSPPDTVIGAGRRATGWPDLTPKWTPLRAHLRFNRLRPCGAHETPQEPRCFTGATSLSQAEPLPGTHTLNQKRELWLGLHTTSASSFALPRKTALANRHFPSLAISLEYLLLPPRSALVEAPAGPTPKAFNATTTTLLHVMARLRDKHVYKPMTVEYSGCSRLSSGRKIKVGMPVSQALRHSMRRIGAPELRSVKRELEPQVRASTPKPHSRAEQVTASYGNDPEPDVPMDVTPMAQCAFECFVFKVSAVRTNYRSWLRSSSIHEPSDPPIRLEYILQQKCQARALPRRLITATDVAASTNTPLVTVRKTGNETNIPSQCVMCLPQQPLNDAQTPAQPLGRPTSVHPPLAQRTNQARRPATDTLPHSSHPQAFTCAALSGIPAPKCGSTPKAWLVRQLPRNVGQRPQVISNDLCPSADGGIWCLHTDRSRNTNRPRISRNGSVPGSDGRCVQRAGTYSERVDDSPLQGIPRSRTIIAMSDPNHGKFSPVYQPLSGKDKHADCASVARVQPRTSKGITDLLLLNFVRLNTENPSKKLCPQKQ
ncbi:hypothetical protein niasHT_022154 [Heterodera trifolii]|uniref:Uncharacterized protein n=1 Tax=Heterodera trifolii TaxID=157864 RepID=A0ABD2K957_9BILA